MSKIDKNYDKYISPSLSKGVTGQAGEGKTTSGKAVQVLDNMKNIATTKAHRIHGMLKGEGWNNNLTVLKAIRRDNEEARVSLRKLEESPSQMTFMNFKSKIEKLNNTLNKITKMDDLFGDKAKEVEGEMAPLLSHASAAKPMTKREKADAELDREIKRSAHQGEADFHISARKIK